MDNYITARQEVLLNGIERHGSGSGPFVLVVLSTHPFWQLKTHAAGINSDSEFDIHLLNHDPPLH